MPLRRASLLALALALSACARGTEAELLAQVRQGLAAREARVRGFHLEGTVAEAGQEAAFDVSCAGPGRILATLTRPTALTLAYDGQRFYELVPAEKALNVYELKLPAEQAALFLAAKFSAFVPEGFRAPLLPARGVTARRVQHPRAPQAVELRFATGAADQALAVTYVLRWPGLDFLEKRTDAAGARVELHTEAERCDQRLGLCFPERLSEWTAGNPGAVTRLLRMDLNPALASQPFTLSVPDGFTRHDRALVEGAAK